MSGQKWRGIEKDYIIRMKEEAGSNDGLHPSREQGNGDRDFMTHVSRETSTKHFLYNSERKRLLRLLLLT